MCGRYGRRGNADKQALADQFHAGTELPEHFFAPNYNAAPTTLQPAVCISRETAEREITAMRWGLLAGSMTGGYSTINARDDSLTSKPLWKRPFLQNRCLIPASFFYEWEPKAKPKDPSVPHLIQYKDQRTFAFGGIYSPWRDPKSGEWFDTFAIVTVEPNATLSPFHNRCPLVIPPSRYDEWLHADSTRPPLHLLTTLPDEDIMEYRCNSAVGNVRNNGPELLLPAD